MSQFGNHSKIVLLKAHCGCVDVVAAVRCVIGMLLDEKQKIPAENSNEVMRCTDDADGRRLLSLR